MMYSISPQHHHHMGLMSPFLLTTFIQSCVKSSCSYTMPPPGNINRHLTKIPFKHIKVKRLRSQSRPPMRRKLDARKDEQESAATGKIITKHMNKVLRCNPRANVVLSSKKKRKLLKSQMIADREASVMTVEVEVKPSKKSSKEPKSKKSSPDDQDVDMMET